MAVRIEFYGIVRHHAGRAETIVDGATLGAALQAATAALPGLQSCCSTAGRLQPGYIANVNGDRFVSDPATLLADGTTLLLLSSDAGG